MSKATTKKRAPAVEQRQEEEGDHKFLAIVPRALYDSLKAEADSQERTALAQLRRILQERYEGGAGSLSLPPTAPSVNSGAAKTLQ